MSARDSLSSAVLDWLLDPADPGVRYLALRDLVGLPPDDPEPGPRRHVHELERLAP